MAALKNAKHEAVAAAYLADADHVGYRAYMKVFPKASPRAAEVSWSRLLKRDEFAARIATEKDRIANITAASLSFDGTKVLRELGLIGFSNALDFFTVGKDGQPFIDWSNLTREQAAAISSVTIEERLERRYDEETDEYENVPVRKVKYTLERKTQALELLGKYFKLWAEQHDHRHSGTVTLEQLVRMSYEPKAALAQAEDAKLIEHEPVNNES